MNNTSPYMDNLALPVVAAPSKCLPVLHCRNSPTARHHNGWNVCFA